MPRQVTGLLVILIFALAILLTAAPVSAQVRDRITQAFDISERRPVPGNVHPLARVHQAQGPAAASKMLNRMVLSFRPSATQQAALDVFLSEQQNPLSPYYHQWLTPEQYADRFGLSANDIAKVVDWLQGQGFTIDEIAPSRTYVAFSGTVAQAESAFATAIHNLIANGETHYANISDPQLPWPLADVVIGIHGLNDFRPKPRGVVVRTPPRPQFTSSISGNHFLAPDDFATIYDLHPLYSAGLDGTGQKLAVMGQTDLVMSDIATFRSLSGLPANTPTVVLVPGSADPGVVTKDITEASLDVEWAGAVARNATIVYVNSKNGAFDSMNYAVSQNLAPVISISYGDCEANFTTAEINALQLLGQQASSHGQTIVGPSGDSGAADCDFPPNSTTQVTSATHGYAVDVPASLPFVTGVGGTTFSEGTASATYWSPTNNAMNGSALSYIPEIAWNDTSFEIANGGSLAASGGGVSKLFPKPSWQTGAGVPNDGKRDVPDISFNADFNHDGYLICVQGSCVNGYRMANNNLTVAGGTSAGAPVFAGMVALLNQQMNVSQGNVNPTLYPLASTPGVFHDITSGNNEVPCKAGTPDCPSSGMLGFTAGPGYDLVTGLGSIDANNLAAAWPGTHPAAFTLSGSTAAPVTSGGSVQYTITVTPNASFTGTVNLGTSSLPSGADASFTPSAVVISNPTPQTSALQINTTTATLGGNYAVDVTGSAGTLSRGSPITVAIADFQLNPTPASLSLTAGATGNVGTSSIAVSSVNGFTGAITIACNVSASLPGTTCGLSTTSVTTSGATTVTVTAPATRAGLQHPGPLFFPWSSASFALAIGLMLVADGKRSSKKIRAAFFGFLLVIALAMMAGCGGGGSSTTSNSALATTTAKTGTVTITGTSGAITRTATVNVTVN